MKTKENKNLFVLEYINCSFFFFFFTSDFAFISLPGDEDRYTTTPHTQMFTRALKAVFGSFGIHANEPMQS